MNFRIWGQKISLSAHILKNCYRILKVQNFDRDGSGLSNFRRKDNIKANLYDILDLKTYGHESFLHWNNGCQLTGVKTLPVNNKRPTSLRQKSSGKFSWLAYKSNYQQEPCLHFKLVYKFVNVQRSPHIVIVLNACRNNGEKLTS